MQSFSIFIVLLLSSSTSVYSQENHSLHGLLESCRIIKDSPQRLQCYDTINVVEKNSAIQSKHDEQINNKAPVLIADLEEPRLFTSLGRMNFLNKDISAVLLGAGTRLKLKTFDVSEVHNNIDFNVIGMIKSQFDVDELDTRNNRGGSLINTDFMLGAELIKYQKNTSYRLKYSHRSTHLGDEFLIDNPQYLKSRVNLSYETIDFLAYQKLNRWALYLGSSYITRSEPNSLDKLQFQTGIQYQQHASKKYAAILGIDFKSWQATNWHLNTSVKVGVEFNGLLDRPLQILLEYSDGKSPYGQFITEDLQFFGLSINHFW